MEMTNLITSPFGLGEKLILKLLERRESVYTVFPSPKDVPMSFLGKMNLKYGFVKFAQEQHITKGLPRKVKNVFHIYELYQGSFPGVFKANTLTTLLLLDWAKNVGVERFIYLSSGEVYGQGENLTESSGYKAHNFYATTKFQAEYLLKYYTRYFSINTVRVFFPFGKSVRQGLVADIYNSIARGDAIDTPYERIGITFVDDIVEPLLRILQFKGKEVFNLCGETIKVSELITKIGEIIKKKPKAVKTGKLNLSGDCSRAKKLLGFKQTPLDSALRKSFEK